MTPAQRAWVRSPRGQLSLIAAVYAGSILFSLGAALSRSAVFDRTVYESFEPVPAHLAALTPEQLQVLPTEDRRRLYGQRINTGDGVAIELLADRPGELHDWLRATIVTGSPEQRRAATALLPAVRDAARSAELQQQIHQTATYARERALALNDAEWLALADAVLGGA